MKFITAQQIAQLVSYDELINVLRYAFCVKIHAPERHVHNIKRAGEADGSLLLMPAWYDMASVIDEKTYAGLKTVFVLPDNDKRNAPTVQANYLLFNGESGDTLAVVDGNELTLRRTACASGLACDFLARKDAAHLLIVGAGALAPHLVQAHCAVRPITTISIFNRNVEKAKLLADRLCQQGFNANAITDIKAAVEQADIISCATTSTHPIIKGDWLSQGTHLDLVGAFKPDMRESDGKAVKISDVFVDTRGGAMSEAGDLLQAESEGYFRPSDIIADLFDLAQGKHKGRQNDVQITLFKSCGTALEDLAAAAFVYEKALG